MAAAVSWLCYFSGGSIIITPSQGRAKPAGDSVSQARAVHGFDWYALVSEYIGSFAQHEKKPA